MGSGTNLRTVINGGIATLQKSTARSDGSHLVHMTFPDQLCDAKSDAPI